MTANEELAEKVEVLCRESLQREFGDSIIFGPIDRRAGRTRRGRSHSHSDHPLRGRCPGPGRRESRGSPERRREAAAETGTPGAAGVVLRPGTRAFAPREDAGGSTVAGTVPGIQRTVPATVWSRPSRRYGTCRHRTGAWFPAFCSAGADGDREPGVPGLPGSPAAAPNPPVLISRLTGRVAMSAVLNAPAPSAGVRPVPFSPAGVSPGDCEYERQS